MTYAYKSNLGKEGRIDFGLRGQLVVLGLSWRWEQGQLVLVRCTVSKKQREMTT